MRYLSCRCAIAQNKELYLFQTVRNSHSWHSCDSWSRSKRRYIVCFRVLRRRSRFARLSDRELGRDRVGRPELPISGPSPHLSASSPCCNRADSLGAETFPADLRIG
jgi:hypothetical protein